jgi:hypothetical protein
MYFNDILGELSSGFRIENMIPLCAYSHICSSGLRKLFAKSSRNKSPILSIVGHVIYMVGLALLHIDKATNI